MSIPLYQVDAFTSTPYSGNPAAVCLLNAPQPDGWLQEVAREMNLSETAFVVPVEDSFGLRWFTPAVEVDLCGHATLASAHILWETGRLKPEESARFHTNSGLLTATKLADRIELDFPAEPALPVKAPEALRRALAADFIAVAQNRFDYLVELTTEAYVRAVTPDFVLLATLSARGVMVTARSDSPGYDFVSRFFAPAAGIDEDPVTGSAHCALGPYWGVKLGKKELTGYQASARGGTVHVRVKDERVILGGQAVTVFRGGLLEK
jgi:PhzF family phenazine biosynthesis protein